MTALDQETAAAGGQTKARGLCNSSTDSKLSLALRSQELSCRFAVLKQQRASDPNSGFSSPQTNPNLPRNPVYLTSEGRTDTQKVYAQFQR